MPFVHPGIFWAGLAAVSLPVIIHLLNRRRFRVRDWAAMRFLVDSMRKNRRRLRIEEMILLALRCGVVFALGMALARFTGCGVLRALPLGGARSESVVFILNDSCSMGQRAGASSLFAAAATSIGEQAGQLAGDDRLAVVLTSRPGVSEALLGPTFASSVDVDSLVSRLALLEPSDGRARLAESLAAAREMLADAAGDKRVVILSDFRRVDLAAGASSEAIRQQFDALAAMDAKVVAWDYGLEGPTNLTIESIELLDRLAVVGVPIRVGVSVRNNGTTTARNVEVRLSVRMPRGPAGVDAPPVEAQLPVRVVGSIGPGQTHRLEARVAFPQTGHALVRASSPADELPADNQASLAINVRDALRVLVVDGRPDVADPVESESYFFRVAIDPGRDGSYGVRPDVIGAAGLAGADLDTYDAVVLLNVRDMPAQTSADGAGVEYPALEALQQYVADGGGLAIFTGPGINLTFYNGPFHADGVGLCPYRIGAPKGDLSQPDAYFRLDPKAIASVRMLRCFAGEAAAMTGLIRFFAFHPAQVPQAGVATPEIKPPRRLASFTDDAHSPAIVSRQYHKGTVVMFYSTASTRWNDWPIDEMGTYVAVMNDMLSYLARPAEPLTAVVGVPIEFDLPPLMNQARVTLKLPRYPKSDLVVLRSAGQDDHEGDDGKRTLRYDRADQAGLYEVAMRMGDGGEMEILLARNPDPAEGDLAPGGRAALAAALGTNEFAYVKVDAQAPAPTAELGREKEYWKWAIAAMLAMMAAETYLGRKFGHYASDKADS